MSSVCLSETYFRTGQKYGQSDLANFSSDVKSRLYWKKKVDCIEKKMVHTMCFHFFPQINFHPGNFPALYQAEDQDFITKFFVSSS